MAEDWTYDGPDWIYLQPDCDADAEGRTWCKDAINIPTEERQDQTEPTDCPYVRGDIHDAVVKKLAESNRVKEHLLIQAQCHAMEARTQRNTVNQVGSLLGGVGDWGPIVAGVAAMKERLAERDAEVGKLHEFFARMAHEVWGFTDPDAGDFHDHAVEQGLLVPVPASEEFKAEWGSDEMMVFSWSTLTTEPHNGGASDE